MLNFKSKVTTAYQKICAYIRETPLDYSQAFSQLTGANVYLKCENLQYNGSFKVRGAFNKLLTLTASERKKGIVTASSGNHGTGVACGLHKFNIPGNVFVPENTSSVKIDNIRRYHIPVEFYGNDYTQTETHALQYAKEHDKVYISPYNDPNVIYGQGTIGLEIMHQLPTVDAVFAPVGGGGLISGIAGYLNTLSPHTHVIGCLPANSPVMAASVKAGKIIEMDTQPTLSDATAGGVEPDAITFDLCRTLVKEYILVSEDEIKQAILSLIKTQHMLVEGASGVALSAFLKSAERFRGKNIVIVLSGANINLETLKSLLA